MKHLLLLCCLYVLGPCVCVARAEMPPCTGDRHVDCVDPPTTTTTSTTLPSAGCPDPAPCQPVTCGGTVVLVERCAPLYYKPCKETRRGLRCPKPHYRGRVLAPYEQP
jgi:hypothetical protein